jgi:hypothetical protein
MHIDYPEPTLGGSLRAEADIVRSSSTIGTVNIDVTGRQGDPIATVQVNVQDDSADSNSPWRLATASTGTNRETPLQTEAGPNRARKQAQIKTVP